MRICEKHRERASEILKSQKTGEEFDLCSKCEVELREILYGPAADEQPTDEIRHNGPRRPAGRPKKKIP